MFACAGAPPQDRAAASPRKTRSKVRIGFSSSSPPVRRPPRAPEPDITPPIPAAEELEAKLAALNLKPALASKYPAVELKNFEEWGFGVGASVDLPKKKALLVP